MLSPPLKCDCKFFVRDYRILCYDTFSMIKPGPPFSNNLLNKPSERPATYFAASFTHEQYHPLHPSRDKQVIEGCLASDSLTDKFFLDVITVDRSYHFGNKDSISETDDLANSTERYQQIEEPWLHLDVSSLSFENIDSIIETDVVNCQVNVDATAERVHPTEEPWMFNSHIEPLDIITHSVSDATTFSEPAQDPLSLVDFLEERQQASEKLLSGRDSHLISHESFCSTEILINCSVCTMQRIAVLEDGCLVELLLEPVRSNVQCDSVYLGVITKLVPHMGGAFVNIGGSRSSLMDINTRREPFIFPPFGTTKENDLNDSSLCIIKQAIKKDDVVSEYEPDVDFEDGDFEEHDYEDDIGLGNQLNGNENHLKAQSEIRLSHAHAHKSNVNIQGADEMWALVRKGTKIIVQVVKERLGSKNPTLTPYPKLRSRFWVLITRGNSIGVSKKISGVERTRLRVIAKSLQPPGFGVTVRTVAAGHSVEELQKDLEGLLSTWKSIMEHAKSAALAADEGVEGALPVILHQAMGQTLSVVQDYFNEKVKRMVVDSLRTYHEVTNYLQDIAPNLCERVELHKKNVPLFDEFNIEEEINNILNKRVALPNGGSLVIEQTEALVSIDVNGGHGMFGEGTSQEKAILDVNLAAAKQIARELRLRDIGGIIVVDFIDMMDDSNKRLIYEEVSQAVERDRSTVKVSELSKHGLMEITRKRVRPSVTFLISEPCTCCHGTGRVEALETSFSKIEHEICSLLATMDQKADPESPKSWPRLLLRVDTYMCDYLTSGKKTKLATLSSSLKVWILLKVVRSFTRGAYELKIVADEKGNNNHHQAGGAMLTLEADSSNPTKRTKIFSVKKWKAGREV